MQTETTRDHDTVVEWRRDRLVEAGFSLPEADRVSSDSRYDLHELLELVQRGCQPDLAVRILAPLEEASAA